MRWFKPQYKVVSGDKKPKYFKDLWYACQYAKELSDENAIAHVFDKKTRFIPIASFFNGRVIGE